MSVTKYTTASSIWTVDTDSKIVTRIMRGGENGGETDIPSWHPKYTEYGKPEAYHLAEVFEPIQGVPCLRVEFENKPAIRSGEIIETEVTA